MFIETDFHMRCVRRAACERQKRIKTEKILFLSKMQELLSQLNELTDEEWKQVQQLKNKKKPSVSFSKATLKDCVRTDGLALNIDYATVKAPSLHIPVDFSAPTASAHLCETLLRIERVWWKFISLFCY